MVDEVDPRDKAMKAGIVGNDGDKAAIQHLLQFRRPDTQFSPGER